jgi:hypothetical protein
MTKIDTPAILAADRAKFSKKQAAYRAKAAAIVANFEIGQKVRNRPGSIIGEIVGFGEGRDGAEVSVKLTYANRTHNAGEVVLVYPEVLKAI